MLRAVCFALLLCACSADREIKDGKKTRFYIETDYCGLGFGCIYILTETATGCEWVVLRGTESVTMDRIPQWGKKTCGVKP
jgi:hypothetical protein